MPPAIEIRELSVLFRQKTREVRAVEGVTLTVESGRIFGFLGPNGAGKTTTMHVLLGFIPPTSGEARIFGQDVRCAIARQRIGYLPEHPDTYLFLTGRELLWLTGRLFLFSGADLRKRVEAVLNEVEFESTAADRRIATYSRGMLQRIALAQALINDPDLVILDEPTSGLDPVGRMAVRRVISRLRERGKTVFFSSHELSEVEKVCDDLAILSRGRLVACGPTEQLLRGHANLEKYFLHVIGALPSP